MTTTKIEWATDVWNPVTGDGICHPDRLEQPLHWRKPRRVFVCSMGDLFHEAVPDEFINRVFLVMALADSHTFMILTKRPDRMHKWINSQPREDDECGINGWSTWPLPNVWLGVSAENQQAADERIPLLLQTPAAVRFVSVEPMLGALDMEQYLYATSPNTAGPWSYPSGRIVRGGGIGGQMCCQIPARELHWVICGPESGPNARPMPPDWARSLRYQCVAAGVAFFLKQMWIDGKLVKMPMLDGVAWNQFPGVAHE
jgi:protein gp37